VELKTYYEDYEKSLWNQQGIDNSQSL
jgi:hypothetical protein